MHDLDGETATVLTRSAALALLRSVRVGRVVYTELALPAITPVYFVMDGETVVVRTRPTTRLARCVDGSVVAFQADAIDEKGGGGWSVIVTGVAELLCGDELARARDLPILSWPGDQRSNYIRIMPTVVTGRVEAPKVPA